MLCRKGYGIDKSSLPESSIGSIKRELIVSPKVQGDYGIGQKNGLYIAKAQKDCTFLNSTQ